MLFLACALLLATPLALGAESTENASVVPETSLQSFGPPPEFRAMATMQMGNMVSCLTQPALKGIEKMITDGAAAGLSQMSGGACPGSETIPRQRDLSCRAFRSPGSGEFSYEIWARTKKNFEASAAVFACKKGQIESMQSQLSCLTTEADMLARRVASLQSSYTQNIQRMQQDVAKLTSIEEDRKSQLEDVSGKLTGKGADGSPGLLGIREEVQKSIAAMPSKIQEIKEAQLEAERQRKSFEEMAQSRTVILANSCFMRTRSSFKCTPNGQPVNAREYVLCRYKQNQRVGPSGVIQEGELASKQAEAKAKELETILDAILADSPADPGKMKTPEDQQAAANRPIKILSEQDLENRYGAQLAEFNGNGLDIKAFISKTMGNCFTEAKQSVEKERKIANSGLAQFQESIKKQERMTSMKVNELLNGYAQIHGDAMSALTGQHLPLNVSNCQNAKPETQLACLSDIRKNMEGLLLGTTPQSTMDIVIRGNNPQTNISFKCQGLNGCITYMQNAQRNLQLEVKKVGQFKKDYVLKSNQSVESFTKGMAQVMSIMSQSLSSRLKEMNATLAMLGVRPGVDIRHVRGRKLTKDKDTGLYEMPDDVVDLIGGQMSPPMLDVQGDTFASALDGISSRMQELKDKEGELSLALKDLDDVPGSCQRDLLRETQADAEIYARCLSNVADCKAIPENSLESLNRTLAELNLGGEGDTPNIAAILSNGTNVCNQIRTVRTGTTDENVQAMLGNYDKCKTAQKKKDTAKAKMVDGQREIELKEWPDTAARTAALEANKRPYLDAEKLANDSCSVLGDSIDSEEAAKTAKADYLKKIESGGLVARNEDANTVACASISRKMEKKTAALADIERAMGGKASEAK